MIIGHVGADGDPVIRLAVQASGLSAHEHEVEAVLDTGFNGSLALPPSLIEALSLRQVSREVLTLASGAKHVAKQYDTTVIFGKREQLTEIIEAAEPLVGAGLLWDHKVCINYTTGGRVELEELA